MTAVLLLLRKIPWWLWPVLGLISWGGWQHMRAGRLQDQVDKAAAEHAARLAMSNEIGRILKASAAQREGVRNEQDKRTAARHQSQLDQLRSRPDRLPAAAAASCQGSTGAELSRPDGQFLAGEAARAERLISKLEECEGRLDDIYAAQPQH